MADRAEEYFRRVAGDGRNEFEGSARAGRTWKQYACAIGRFEAWCGERKLRALPALVDTAKAWVIWLAREKYAASTIRTYLTGISVWHKLQGHSLDLRPLSETLRGIRRRSPPARKVRPLLREELASMLAMFDPTKLRDARDGALLAVGWATALRRIEIVGLDWQRRTRTSNGTGVLRLFPDRIEVELLRSKTSQEAAVLLDIPADEMPSAMQWLSLWANMARLQVGEPVFRPIISMGDHSKAFASFKRLTDSSAATIIKERVVAMEMRQGAAYEEAAERAQDFSGHSLRAGYCTSAAVAGTPEYLIRQRSRHKSAEVVAGYVRAAETRKEHGLGKVGM